MSKKFLYDTRYYGQPKLRAFIPEHKLSYYAPQHEIYKSFEEAKSVVEGELLAKINYWQDELNTLLEMDEDSVPVEEDPYV